MRDRIIEYLSSRYAKTLWPNFSVVELTRFLDGVYPKQELNQMLEEGLIVPGKGVHGLLIILTPKGRDFMLNNPNVNKNN